MGRPFSAAAIFLPSLCHCEFPTLAVPVVSPINIPFPSSP